MVYDHRIYLGFYRGSGYESVSAGIENKTGGTFTLKDGRISNLPAFTACLKDCFLKNRIGDKNVRLILKTPECILRFAKLPPAGDKDIRGIIMNNLRDYFPVPVDGYVISYKIYRKTKDAAEIMLAALPEDMAANYLEAFRILGKKVIKIDILQNAVANASFIPDETALFVTRHINDHERGIDIDIDNRLNVMLMENGVPIAARDIGADGGELIALTRMYGINGAVKIYAATPEYENISMCLRDAGADFISVDIAQLLARYE